MSLGVDDLVIDIETIPVQSPAHKEYLLQNLSPPSNYKTETAINKWIDENRDKVLDKTGLNGMWGEVISIAWAINDSEIFCYQRPADEEEGPYLLKAGREIHAGLSGPVRWVGFNLGFDTRFLLQRLAINGVSWPLRVPADESPWSSRIYDVQYHWGGRETKGNSLAALSQAFGLGGKQGDWSELEFWWKNGEEELIGQYNMQDVHLTRELFKLIEPLTK